MSSPAQWGIGLRGGRGLVIRPIDPGFHIFARSLDDLAQVGGMDTVFQKRLGRDEERDNNADGMTATELMRSASEPSRAESAEARNEEKISIFWRVFGGTILSIVALAVITLYNSISTNISDLRNELNREREARADLVK